MNRRTEVLGRARFIQILFVLMSCLIIYRVGKIALVDRDYWIEKKEVNYKYMPVYSERGNILSDDKKLLSTSLTYYDIYADLSVVDEKIFRDTVADLALQLHNVVGKHSTKTWKKKLKNAKKKRYFPIIKDASVEQFNLIKNFPIFSLGRYRGGFQYRKYGKRIKPLKQLASMAIGIDREKNSKGLERYYDNYLSGERQKVMMKKVNSTTWIPAEDMNHLSPKIGNDIVSTINVNFQDIAHDELNTRLKELNAKMGVVILMEVKTGAIKAMVNLSKYDDGNFYEARNIAVTERTEPGSTMKLASTLAMIDDGYLNLDSKVNLNGGKLKMYDYYLRDSHEHGIYDSTLRYAFEHSSNVGIGRLADKYYNNGIKGKQHFVDKLRKFGLGDTSGIDLYGENRPYLKDPKNKKDKWSGISIPWMAHGYEYTATPLQVLKFYNTIANNGEMMKPYLVSDILIEDGENIKIEPVIEDKAIASDKAISMVKELLRGAVVNGTGNPHLISDLVTIAGKTGTTVTNYSSRSKTRKYNASFAGYFPADDPQYSMIVVVYDPKGKFYGGNAAGPVFKNVAERVMAFDHKDVFAKEQVKSFDLPSAIHGFNKDYKELFDFIELPYKNKNNDNWIIASPVSGEMIVEKSNIKKSLVPDVTGMGGRDAIYVLENIGMKVKLHGVGHVVEQSVDPGTRNKGQEISIKLN